MDDGIFRQGGRKRKVDWLAIDSWIDSSLFGSWESIKDRWADITAFNQRFNLSGVTRAGNELLSEGLSLATIGLALLLGLAQPAFDIIAKGDPLGYLLSLKLSEINHIVDHHFTGGCAGIKLLLD